LADAVRFYTHNRVNGSLVSSGETRRYLLYVPRSYDRARPAPLVISLHGAGGWPVQQMEASQWNALAERERFIVVYPSGRGSGEPRVWHVESGERMAKDVRFISDLIDKLEADYNIDPRRIYANGLSNGGGMSFALSCTMPGRIAAVGVVAGAQTLPARWCADRPAVPAIFFHGTADPVVPYNGGVTWIASHSFPNIPIFVTNWAKRNRCAREPVESAVAPNVTLREYTNCADGATVDFYTLRGGGHSWPGGPPMPEWLAGTTSREIDATSRMWAFFQAHPLSGARTSGPQSADLRSDDR
jgi:polyhydroxybutyrate depolymerase